MCGARVCLRHRRIRPEDRRDCRRDDTGTDSAGLRNIAAILEAAGTSLDKAVSATIILADEDDFAGLNEEWVKWFPTNPPARQGAKLPVRIPRLKVSIAMIAEA
jgi:enamine deaminase RidA (YjgF/YER057c/UK114 family)